MANTFVSVFIAADIVIAVVLFIAILLFCRRIRRRRRTRKSLENVRISVGGTVVGTERIPDAYTEVGMEHTLWGQIFGRPDGVKYAYVVRVDDTAAVIRGKTMTKVLDAVGKDEYDELSRSDQFRGSEVGTHVYVDIDQEEYTAYTEPFGVRLGICPLSRTPGSIIERGEHVYDPIV